MSKVDKKEDFGVFKIIVMGGFYAAVLKELHKNSDVISSIK